MIVEPNDDVAALNAGSSCRSVRPNFRHDSTLDGRHAEVLRHLARHRLYADTEEGPLHGTRIDEFVADPLGQIDRHGKADAFATAAVGRDGRVDADDLSLQVDQRSTAVTRIDGGIGLQVILALGDADSARLGRDDADRHRFLESERRSDCQHPITNLQGVAIAHCGCGQFARSLDANDGDIGLRIGFDFGARRIRVRRATAR